MQKILADKPVPEVPNAKRKKPKNQRNRKDKP